MELGKEMIKERKRLSSSWVKWRISSIEGVSSFLGIPTKLVWQAGEALLSGHKHHRIGYSGMSQTKKEVD